MHSGKVVTTTVTEKMTVLFGTTFTQTTIFYLTYKTHYCYVHSLTVLSTKILAFCAVICNYAEHSSLGTLRKYSKSFQTEKKVSLLLR